jgi:4-hydroxythreonine-4-phosphate dehydrogenase
VTLGDPTGIGPEVVVRALASYKGPRQGPSQSPRPVVHGHREVLDRACELLGLIRPDLELREPPTPAPFERPGQAQLEALDQAVRSALSGEVDALVTAPIHKETIRRAGFDFPGHTEFLAHRTGAEVAMMFATPRLKVSLATIHIPLAEVPAALTAERLTTVLRLTAEALVRDFAVAAPRIAVAGINPHAGEAGILGWQELRVMKPALAAALPGLRRALGDALEVDGPLPADTIFRKALDGRYDAVLAAYHDQALIPIKLVAFSQAVNLTLGLPFVRTSPAHGTAHDIAWTGVADARSMVAALDLAKTLACRRLCASPPG